MVHRLLGTVSGLAAATVIVVLSPSKASTAMPDGRLRVEISTSQIMTATEPGWIAEACPKFLAAEAERRADAMRVAGPYMPSMAGARCLAAKR